MVLESGVEVVLIVLIFVVLVVRRVVSWLLGVLCVCRWMGRLNCFCSVDMSFVVVVGCSRFVMFLIVMMCVFVVMIWFVRLR